MRDDRKRGDAHSAILLNNMAHANLLLGDEVSARRCLHSLSETIMNVLVESQPSWWPTHNGDNKAYPIMNAILANITASILGHTSRSGSCHLVESL
jgi:hypothetical protein